MAIVKMKKLALVGIMAERNKLLKAIHRMGCVEITTSDEFDNTRKYSDIYLKDSLMTKLSKLSFAFNFLKDTRLQAVKLKEKFLKLKSTDEPEISDAPDNTTAIINYEPPKKAFTIGLPAVKYDKFETICDREKDLLEIVDKLEKLNGRLIDIKSDMIRLKSLMEQLEPYLEIDAAFNKFKDTKNVAVMLGLAPANKLKNIQDISDRFPEAEIMIFNAGKYLAVVTVVAIELKEDILSALVEADYSPNTFNFPVTAREKYNECIEKTTQLERLRDNIVLESTGYENFIADLEILYDYYNLELKKAEADDNFRFTEASFYMEGWFPEEAEQRIDRLHDKFTVYIETREPKEKEIVPTLTKNSGMVSPYEDITNMYSVPDYREADPNPFVAIFYFIFFGIMVSDAGYGIILALGAYILYRYAKPRKGEGKLLIVIAMGGVSTFIWGAMFGGWFGINLKPLLFNPMDNPLGMLGLSLGLGLLQIMFGMGIHAVALFRQRKYLDAIFNVFGWYAVFLGLGVYALSLAPKLCALKNVGFIIAIIGVLGVFLGGGLEKKGILKKVGGGLGNLYNVTGLMSDILSYSRLFGLGLATGVVGMVLNQLASVAVELLSYAGYIVAIPLLIGGHIFNIAINTLGAYVHNSRLTYIEFFSKFYTGAGHQFVPFGSNTKYIYIEN